MEETVKCIISDSGKTIERVKNEIAREKVKTTKWSYLAKSIWKEQVRDFGRKNKPNKETK